MPLIPHPPSLQPVRNGQLSEIVGPNVVVRQMRDMFREAFDELGGSAWLVEFARASDSNARVFVQAISKLLPPSANPPDKNERIIIDIPWLTAERLSYKQVAEDRIGESGEEKVSNG